MVAEDTRQPVDTLVRLQNHTTAVVHILALVDLSLNSDPAAVVVEEGSRVVGCVLEEDSREVVPLVVHHILQLQVQAVADYIRHRIPAVAAEVVQYVQMPSHPWCHKKSRWHPA